MSGTIPHLFVPTLPSSLTIPTLRYGLDGTSIGRHHSKFGTPTTSDATSDAPSENACERRTVSPGKRPTWNLKMDVWKQVIQVTVNLQGRVYKHHSQVLPIAHVNMMEPNIRKMAQQMCQAARIFPAQLRLCAVMPKKATKTQGSSVHTSMCLFSDPLWSCSPGRPASSARQSCRRPVKDMPK